MCGADIFARERWRDPAHLLAYGKSDLAADAFNLRPQITVSHHPEENLDDESIPALASKISVSPLTQRVRRNTNGGIQRVGNPFVFNEYSLVGGLPLYSANKEERICNR
jgi:hypothetical protein